MPRPSIIASSAIFALILPVWECRGKELPPALNHLVVGARVKVNKGPLKIGGRVVAADAGNRVFKVVKVQNAPMDDPWLWLVADDLSGWAKESQVTTATDDDLLEYLTWRIREDSTRRDLFRAALNLCERGLLWMKKSDWQLAIADFDESIKLTTHISIRLTPDEWPKLNHDESQLYVNRAKAYYFLANSEKKGPHDVNYERAIGDGFEAVRFDPNNPEAYYIRGVAYLAKERYERAIMDFDKAISLAPRFQVAKDARDRAKIYEECSSSCEVEGGLGVVAGGFGDG